MNLADIITLAKQGYKPQDIKELIALGAGDGAGDGHDDGAGDGHDDGAGDGHDDGAGDGAGDGHGDGGKSEMDQLVNQLKKQNKNLQDALKRMDLSGDEKTESASDILKETLTSLF